MRRGCSFTANAFISPYVPYFSFSLYVSITTPAARAPTDTQAEELTHAAHIQDDDDQECPDKSPGADEKVLASQSFKFDGRIHALMDFECCHILIRCAEK